MDPQLIYSIKKDLDTVTPKEIIKMGDMYNLDYPIDDLRWLIAIRQVTKTEMTPSNIKSVINDFKQIPRQKINRLKPPINKKFVNKLLTIDVEKLINDKNLTRTTDWKNFLELVPQIKKFGECIKEGLELLYIGDHVQVWKRIVGNNKFAEKIIFEKSDSLQNIELFREERLPLELRKHGCHPNVICLLLSEHIGDIYKFTYKYFDSDLQHITLPSNKGILVDIAYQIARGLEWLHKHGVAHRDIKPANILMNSYKPIIADFGFSCLVSDKYKLQDYNKLKCNVFITQGTRTFLPPEIIDIISKAELLPADIYALGVTFYFLFNKKQSPIDINYKGNIDKYLDIKRKTPVKESNFDPIIDHLIAKMLSSDPKSRPTISTIRKILYCHKKNY